MAVAYLFKTQTKKGTGNLSSSQFYGPKRVDTHTHTVERLQLQHDPNSATQVMSSRKETKKKRNIFTPIGGSELELCLQPIFDTSVV